MTLIFEAPSLTHKAAVDRIVREADVRVCDQTFGNLFCWAASMEVRLALWEDTFCARWGNRHTVPYGAQRAAMLEQLIAQGVTRLSGIDAEYKAWLEQAYPDRFSFREAKNFDYIYDRQRLQTLSGKKLAAKRNHINYFEQQHQWEVRPISAENLQEIKAFNDWWCRENRCAEENSLAWEGCAVRLGLEHYEALGFSGLALYAEGKVCAFTYGEPQGKEGFCIHAEKADAALRGAYPMINREFLKTLPAEIRWINREDDAGDEGLKKAKMSYRPELLLMKYEAEVIG